MAFFVLFGVLRGFSVAAYRMLKKRVRGFKESRIQAE
jgi:hypothetical protein